jgi:hypothetical protein
MRIGSILVALMLSLMAGCGPPNPNPNDNGSDGLKNGLIEYPPDKDGYVTSAFQGVDTYSATAMSYICIVIAVKTGHDSSALINMRKMDKANGINIGGEASGLLLRDANNWWSINRNKIDIDRFFNDFCETAIDNVRQLYGDNSSDISSVNSSNQLPAAGVGSKEPISPASRVDGQLPGVLVPTKVGQCARTSIRALSYRFDGDPESGSAITYENGIFGVGYDLLPAIESSKIGDPIKLCLTWVPEECPAGDERGKVYSAVNLRTAGRWELPDSPHACGGA